MSKRVLIVSTSLRRGSNSDLLAEAFEKGAEDAGHRVERIRLAGKEIRFCRGCLSCQETRRCVIRDDAAAIVEQMKEADVLVFATPIYYYEMSGQMKTLLDRANPLFPSEYAFRDIYLLACAAEDGGDVWQRAADGLGGWIACFEKARLAGVIFGGNVTRERAAANSEAVDRAYSAGRAL